MSREAPGVAKPTPGIDDSVISRRQQSIKHPQHLSSSARDSPRDDVVVRGPSPTPVLLRGSVHGRLRRGHGVRGGHKPVDDAPVVVENLGHRGEAVGSARRVGHDVHGRVILLVVDPHNEHRRVVGRG